MKVVIVAKTHKGLGACIGAVSFEGQSLRLLAPEWDKKDGRFNLEYNVGDVWDITYEAPEETIPPHIESVVVTDKRRLPPLDDLCSFVMARMAPVEGGTEALFQGLTQVTRLHAQYISERTGIPAFSTMFWRPDRPLSRVVDQSVRIRYCYPDDQDGRTLTYVGFQEPLDEIPAGALVRVSLAHWWRPDDKPDDELRCYVQLSGWVEDCAANPVTAVRREPTTTRAGDSEYAWGLDEAAEQLQRVFGFDSFRKAQSQIIGNMAARHDTLAVMPTGSGKSLCYQLPATLFPGLTVVVSPLIALMEDQVVQLHELDIPAAFLNSTLQYDEQLHIMQQVRAGRIILLYVAPETLLRPEILRLLDDVTVDCLAIDEAHCISEWGHDFRPEYRQLGDVRRRLPQAVCLALTATATQRVRQDIRENLGIADADEIVTSFNRDNLFLGARERQPGRQQLNAFLRAHRGESGLIYCLTRNDVDRLTADLQNAGLPAIPYHAGLDSDTRRLHHRRFTFEEDAIVVATIAFGMGINKSNVRFVVHYGMPKELESYYQQIGRAGRDGLRADCLLLYSAQDQANANFHIGRMPAAQRAPAATRLREMSDFAETRQCRRRPLLRYFDEAYEEANCGMCDNCLAGPQEKVDLTIPAQKFLSCVKRTGERFGASYIIDVLLGSRNQKILGNGHNQLSTHGIGREFSRPQWQSLVQQFVEQQLLFRDPNHGGLSVTVAGMTVLRGELFEGVTAKAEQASVDRSAAAPDYDSELFELLRAKRMEIAKRQDVPAFVIFSDRSLQEMATYFPQTVAELLEIHGIGEAKLANYGAAMLAVLQTYCQAHGIDSRPRQTKGTAAPGNARPMTDSRQQQSADLFTRGLTIDKVAAELAIKRITVIGHLWQAAHRKPGLDEALLCREIGVPADTMQTLFETKPDVVIGDLTRYYVEATHRQVTGEVEWLLRLILLNRTHKLTEIGDNESQLRAAVQECVESMPGELPRSGVANLLVGSPSQRIEEYEGHSLYGMFADRARFEVMNIIDAMIAASDILLGEDRRLYPSG